uniref:TM2 domain-containing protein n=1 Tax=Panagrolaimus sp. ES5 TaxID=591445 RepID=A0AC34FPK2_9BILA
MNKFLYFCLLFILLNQVKTDSLIPLKCYTRPDLECFGKDNETNEFEMRIENACRYSTGQNHITALLLSVFLGAVGADRFYLGHFTIADIVFIALEIITPADSSSYFVNQYGPRVFSTQFTNETTLLLYNCFGCVA